MTDHEPEIHFLPPFPSQQEVDSFVLAAGAGKEPEVTAFLDKYKDSINRKNQFGNTALIYAAWLGQPSMVELLLAKGAALDGKSNTGLTPLMAAAWRDRASAAKILLEKGASIDETNNKGKTALMLALGDNYPETAALIRQHAETRRRKAQELAEAESKKQAAARLEKLKRRRPPPPFRKGA
jgi:ankyrin repeat protein